MRSQISSGLIHPVLERVFNGFETIGALLFNALSFQAFLFSALGPFSFALTVSFLQKTGIPFVG